MLAEREADGGTLTSAQVNDSNAAIAALFGLDDLHGFQVLPINGGAYDASDGLSAGEVYGAILAAFSGATLDNGGDSQETLDAVLAGLTVSGSGAAELNETAQSILLEGAQTTEDETGADLGDVIAIAFDTTPPEITSGATADAITENSGSGQVIYTATAAADDTTVTYSLADSGDADDFEIDPDSGEVTLLEDPDFEAQSSYTFTVVATDAAGNASQQTVSLDINNLAEEAPQINSGNEADAIDENTGPDQPVYTATVDTSGDTGEEITFSLAPGGDADAFEIDAETGVVTLLEDPDFEAQSSYAFTVVATDEEDNSSQQQVTLDINDVDEVPPEFTSGTTADAIEENSGSGQVVYTATATDQGTVTYSLENSGDADDFEIDSETGEVTLLEDPDFETQSSYTFTVVATDGEGNSSERTVSLEIVDVDDTPPNVTNVALTGAVGAENNTLNEGDTVTVTVTMSEATTVTGTPRVELNIGGTIVLANFDSGSGTTSLDFTYTVQAGENDTNGISIPANALEANGASLTDAAGNPADLSHGSEADNPSFLVDTTAPTFESSTPTDNATDVAVGNDIDLIFSEDVLAGSGNITISDGAGDTRTIDVTDTDQVSISGSQVTINPTNDLNHGSSYNVQIDAGALTDEGGNPFAGIDDTTTLNFDTQSDTTVVVFDLVQGSSSDHSGRSFQSGVEYDIYIRVDSDTSTLSIAGGGPGTWGTWSGALNLGSDDRIILVGDGADVLGPAGGPVQSFDTGFGTVFWDTASGTAALLQPNGDFSRFTGVAGTVDLWAGSWLFNPNQNDTFNQVYLTAMPANILTSQGLA